MMYNVVAKSDSNKQKNLQIFVVAILEVTDENSRIRIRTKMSRIRTTASEHGQPSPPSFLSVAVKEDRG
jgi:hypothetical protein